MLSRKDTVSLSNSHVKSTEPSKTGELPRDKLFADLWDSGAMTEAEKKLGVEDEKVRPDEAVFVEGFILIPPFQPSLHSTEWELTHFAPTPRMSTYLVALANGDLRFQESSFKSTSGKTIPLRFYATPDQVEQTQLALETTAKLLPMYEKVFDIPYPLAKVSRPIGPSAWTTG